MAALGFISALTLGCGNSNISGNTDFVYTGNNVNPGNTGTVRFQFQRLLANAQTTVNISADVPADTRTLDFAFFDEDGISDSNFIYGNEVGFSEQVSISGVPTSAAFVVITTYDAKGYPISTIADTVEVVAGGETTENLSDAANEPVAFEDVIISPNPINLQDGQTRQVGVSAEFSNGDTVSVPVADAEYDSDNDAIATVSETGVVTAEAPGETSITATVDIRGTEQTGAAEVNVLLTEDV